MLTPALQWFVNFAILVGFHLLAGSCWQRRRRRRHKRPQQLRKPNETLHCINAFYVCACHQHELKVIGMNVCTKTPYECETYCIERSRVQVAIIVLAQSNRLSFLLYAILCSFHAPASFGTSKNSVNAIMHCMCQNNNPEIFFSASFWARFNGKCCKSVCLCCKQQRFNLMR